MAAESKNIFPSYRILLRPKLDGAAYEGLREQGRRPRRESHTNHADVSSGLLYCFLDMKEMIGSNGIIQGNSFCESEFISAIIASY